MTRIMGDSTNLDHIPPTVAIAAAYATGHLGVVTQQQMDARFPHDRYGQVSIDVTGAAPWASVRDWETGDKGGSLEEWVAEHNKYTGKKDAVVYCNRSTIAEVRQLTGSQVLGTDYWLWIATLDGSVYGPGQYPGVIACQVKGAQLTGGDWDMSIVFDASFWQPLPAPKPPVPRVTRAEYTAALAVLLRAEAEMPG